MNSTSQVKRNLLVATPIIIGGVIIAAIAIKGSPSLDTESTKRKEIITPEGGAERAKIIGEFRKVRADDIDARTDQALEKDPSYAKSLLVIDKNFVDTLQGFTEEEKAELWESVKAAQERAKLKQKSTR